MRAGHEWGPAALASGAMPEPHASTPPVTILGGSGALGSALALRLGSTGVPVLLGSRERDRAVEAAVRIAGKLPAGAPAPQGMTNADALGGDAELVLLCVPFRNHSETFTNLRGAFRDGQLLIDATVPLAAAISGKATRTIGVWQGSAAQQARELLPPGVRLVAALHTVSATTLGDPGRTLDEDVLICGDVRADKAQAAALLRRIDGLRPVDAGPLEQARIVEQLTAMLIGINIRHKAHAGLRITGLPPERMWPELDAAEEAAA